MSGQLSPVAVRWTLLALFAVLALSMGIILAVWLDWVASLFHTKIRGLAMGLSWAGAAVAGTLGRLLSGHLIQQNPGVAVYGYLYLAAATIAIIALLTFFLVDDSSAAAEPAPQFSTAIMLRQFRQSLKDNNFCDFLIGRLIARAGFCILPFMAVYYISQRGGGLDIGVVVMCGAANTAGLAVASLALGLLGDRHGHRIGLVIGTAAQVIASLILISSTGLISCILAYAVAGCCLGVDMTSHANMVLETCPHDGRAAHITIGSLIMGVGSVIFPVMAGVAASYWGLQALFWASLIISVVALLWQWLKVREPRQSANGGRSGDEGCCGSA